MLEIEKYILRIEIANTIDLEREVEGELRRRADSRAKKDLDALLRGAERFEFLNHDPGTEALIGQAILAARPSRGMRESD